MSSRETEFCPRCQDVVLDVDEEEGFLVCPQCGHVEDELRLQNTNIEGTYVRQDDSGTAAARGLAVNGGFAVWSSGVGRAPQAGDARALKLRAAQDRLSGIASSMLGYAPRHVDEAKGMLKQIYATQSVHLGGTNKGLDALCAAILLLVGRSSGLPVTLRDASLAANAHKESVGAFYRQLCVTRPAGDQQGPGVGIILRPSQGLRAFCLRFAAKLLQLGSDTAKQASKARARQPATVPAPRAFASETDIRSQPYVKAALEVADLVTKAGIGEGRPPPIMAAGILGLLAGSKTLSVPRGVTTTSVAALAGCLRQTLVETQTLLQDHFLQLAALLPMGSMIRKDNLLCYLPLIMRATHAIVALKKGGEETGQGALAIEAGAAAGAQAIGDLVQQGAVSDVEAAGQDHGNRLANMHYATPEQLDAPQHLVSEEHGAKEPCEPGEGSIDQARSQTELVSAGPAKRQRKR